MIGSKRLCEDTEGDVRVGDIGQPQLAIVRLPSSGFLAGMFVAEYMPSAEVPTKRSGGASTTPNNNWRCPADMLARVAHSVGSEENEKRAAVGAVCAEAISMWYSDGDGKIRGVVVSLNGWADTLALAAAMGYSQIEQFGDACTFSAQITRCGHIVVA